MKKLLLIMVFLGCLCYDAGAQVRHEYLDIYAGPMVGGTVSKMTGLNDGFHPAATGGGYLEVFLTNDFSLDFEAYYTTLGASDATLHSEEGRVKRDVGLGYVNTDYLFKYYLSKRLGLIAGFHAGYMVRAKAYGGSHVEDFFDDMKKTDFSIPVGISYDFGKMQLAAKYFAPMKNVPTSEFKPVMGNAKNHEVMVTLGYRFTVF